VAFVKMITKKKLDKPGLPHKERKFKTFSRLSPPEIN